MRNLLNLFFLAGVLTLAACSSAPVATTSDDQPEIEREQPAWGPTVAPSRPRVVLETNYGDILLELYPKFAPQTVENFLRYVEEGHYNGLIFHRVIKNVLIQGGGYDEALMAPSKYGTIPLEDQESNVRGTIAMARRTDPDSAQDQFFINLRFNRDFNTDPDSGSKGYAVFGQVLRGFEVAQRISEIPTTTSEDGRFEEFPEEMAIIKRAYRVK